jgi:hypothetical protein
MQPSPFKSSVNYGAMYGLACFAVFVLIYWAGGNPLGPASWLAVWIPPLFIYLSIKHYRSMLSGKLTYMEGLRTGLITAASGALLYALIVYIFGKIIDPSIIETYKEEMLTSLESSEATMRGMLGDEMFDRSVEEIGKVTLSGQAFAEFSNKCMGGLIYSLIIAAILKRKPAEVQ